MFHNNLTSNMMYISIRTLQEGEISPQGASLQYMLSHITNEDIPTLKPHNNRKSPHKTYHHETQIHIDLEQISVHSCKSNTTHKHDSCKGSTGRTYKRRHSTTILSSRIVANVGSLQPDSRVTGRLKLHNIVQHTSDTSTNHTTTTFHQENFHTQCVP